MRSWANCVPLSSAASAPFLGSVHLPNEPPACHLLAHPRRKRARSAAPLRAPALASGEWTATDFFGLTSREQRERELSTSRRAAPSSSRWSTHGLESLVVSTEGGGWDTLAPAIGYEAAAGLWLAGTADDLTKPCTIAPCAAELVRAQRRHQRSGPKGRTRRGLWRRNAPKVVGASLGVRAPNHSWHPSAGPSSGRWTGGQMGVEGRLHRWPIRTASQPHPPHHGRVAARRGWSRVSSNIEKRSILIGRGRSPTT